MACEDSIVHQRYHGDVADGDQTEVFLGRRGGVACGAGRLFHLCSASGGIGGEVKVKT